MTLDALTETVKQNDEKAEDAHRRLRETLLDQQRKIDSNYDYFRQRIENLQSTVAQLKADTERLGNAPVNIDKMIFTPKVVASIVVCLLSIWGFFYATTGNLRDGISGVRSDLRDMQTHMEAQQTTTKARSDLQDVQSAALRSDVEQIKRQLQLEQYDIQTLKDLVKQKGQ